MVHHPVDPPEANPPGFPAATYRLQLRPAFDLGAAAAVVSYLAGLGATDAYLSPVFAARPGSEHGYDVCDHARLNPEIGGEEGFAALEDSLAAHGLGALLDLVPNHMAIDSQTNRWWRDVLENGPSSPFSAFFDIDWDPVKPELLDRVLLPVLGDQYGAVLERGELQVELCEGALELRYFDHRLPLNPRQVPRVLGVDTEALRATLGDNHPQVQEFLSILTALQHLPPYVTRDLAQVAERQREKEVARARLVRLLAESEPVRAHVERCVARLNGTPGVPASFSALHDLLEHQAYRLAFWRTAFDEINYRRFFDVNELAGLRTEEPQVFEDTHALVRRLLARGVVRGLRVDHPDGLFDPCQYLERLQATVRAARLEREARPGRPRAESTSGVDEPAPVYLIVEKILTRGEGLPRAWPVDGTTGYLFLTMVNGLFVDAKGLSTLARTWRRLARERLSFADLAYECKKLIMLTSLASELNVLAHAMNKLSERSWRTRDFTLNSCRKALLEVVACLPVYRTYVTEAGASQADRWAVQTALDQARRRNPATEPTIFSFLESLMLPPAPGVPEVAEPSSGERLAFAMKLQQYTGPVHAKGVEDTAYYRYNVLASLNEVGSDPQRGSVSTLDFHDANQQRLRDWPMDMLATSTHDAKRGEDHRARLNVLSEYADEWRRAVGHWMRVNAAHRTILNGQPAPSRNDEYLFYQALIGVWPPDQREGTGVVPPDLGARLTAFMLKAVREAKVHASWVNPNEPYERAVTAFVEGVLASSTTPRFLAAFEPLRRLVAAEGMVNSLAQLALKIAAPGVADVYQGAELWDLSLVDPDNRRAADFDLRRRLLRELQPLLEESSRAAREGKWLAERVRQLLESWPDARIKLYLTACGLRLRRRHPHLMVTGDYAPLWADDVGADHLVAFARRRADRELIAVVPRLTGRLRAGRTTLPLGPAVWGPSRILLPEARESARYRNLVTGETVRARTLSGEASLLAAEVLQTSPVALLWRTS